MDRIVRVVIPAAGADMSRGSVWLVVGLDAADDGKKALRLSHAEEGVRAAVLRSGDVTPGRLLYLRVNGARVTARVLAA